MHYVCKRGPLARVNNHHMLLYFDLLLPSFATIFCYHQRAVLLLTPAICIRQRLINHAAYWLFCLDKVRCPIETASNPIDSGHLLAAFSHPSFFSLFE